MLIYSVFINIMTLFDVNVILWLNIQYNLLEVIKYNNQASCHVITIVNGNLFQHISKLCDIFLL